MADWNKEDLEPSVGTLFPNWNCPYVCECNFNFDLLLLFWEVLIFSESWHLVVSWVVNNISLQFTCPILLQSL